MFKFKLQADDGEQLEFPAGTRDVVVWEKASKDRSMAKLLADLKLADMYAIANIAARRQQLHNGTLAEFEAKFDIVSDLFSIEEEPDPTRQGPSTGPSSPSPSTPESPRKSGPRKKSG